LTPPTTDEELRIWSESLTLANQEKLFSGKYFLRNKDAWTLELADTLPEVRRFKALGGGTIVEMPPIEPVRDVTKLVELSRETKVHVISGTAFYTRAWHPPNVNELSIDDLTRFMVVDLVEGMDGTGVKAGIVGEVPADDLELNPDNNETRILRASARASRLTGAALSLHYTYGDDTRAAILRSLDVIEQEGLDLSRVAAGHLHVPVGSDLLETLAMFEAILARGANLQFDLLGSPEPDVDSKATLDAIDELIKRGYASRILVSQDICSKFHLRKFGGPGLSYVHETLIPELRSRGTTDADISKVIELNPRAILTFDSPQPLLRSK
jgi:phosphotriesterase-related protein